jgi:hypothetical protein
MDVQVSSSLDSLTPVASSAVIENNTQQMCKNPRYRGLTPFQKGQIVPKRGRPKGSVSLKESLIRLLTKSSADQIIHTLIDMAQSGSIQHTKLITELTGDIMNGPPQTSVQVGNVNFITPELIDAARSFLNKNTNPKPIGYTNAYVDVPAIPVSASVKHPRP